MAKGANPIPSQFAQSYVMRIADQLSDDPVLVRLLGNRFKVFVDYDVDRRRVTYSFRSPDDIEPGDENVKLV